MAKKQREFAEMVCKKNDEFLLEIVDMGTEGEGIGRANGYALFVKDALVGDLVRVKVIKTKKHFGYARLLEIVEPSPYRVEPTCSVARQCGGCQLQHCSYEKQLQWKQEKIAGCLNRIGGFQVSLPGEGKDGMLEMEPILGMEIPFHYRNKSQYPVGCDRNGRLIAGFYAGRTHQIIPCEECQIGHPSNPLIIQTILCFMEEYGITAYREAEHRGLVRHILIRVGKATGEVMVCLVINGKKLPYGKELVSRLLSCPIGKVESGLQIKSICLNINEKNTNVILGEQIVSLYGEAYIEDQIGSICYRISPLSFYQVNPEQTRRLYETALEFADLRGGEVVWDLYCGIGTISLFLSQKADKVCGVEIVPQAIENAKENARLNNIENTEFFVGAAEEVVPQKYQESAGTLRADVVVLDPPRKGCDERLLETVVQMQPKRIVYVSCDPATLARDLKYLCGKGYELKRVRGCDMFGMSYHVESVVLLTRVKKKRSNKN